MNGRAQDRCGPLLARLISHWPPNLSLGTLLAHLAARPLPCSDEEVFLSDPPSDADDDVRTEDVSGGGAGGCGGSGRWSFFRG